MSDEPNDCGCVFINKIISYYIIVLSDIEDSVCLRDAYGCCGEASEEKGGT